MSRSALVQVFRRVGAPFELQTVALPARLKSGEILVEISLATVCGSDLHTVFGRRGAPTPCVLGHEAVGRVVDSARDGIEIGQRVTWSIADSCGSCSACTEWQVPQKCAALFKYGHAALSDGSGLNGCYASHILLRPGTHACAVPDELADEIVAPANCALATVVNALAELPSTCRSAVIQGSGLLGIYGCSLLRERGVDRVYCADIDPARLELVAEFGGIPVDGRAENCMATREEIFAANSGGVDLVLEVAGAPEVIPHGIDWLRPGGLYVWAGMVHPATQLSITGESVLRKCLTIRGVHNYAPRHLEEGLEFLKAAQRRLPFERLVSEAVALGDLDQAIELSQSRRWLRVAVKP